MILVSLTEGVSLLLLVPLLQLVGLDMGQGSLNQVATLASSIFLALGIQTTLIMVLGIFVVVMTISALLHRWQMIMTYEVDYKYAAHLRKRLYQAITNSNWLFFSRNKSSDFAHALTSEIERISTGTSQFLTLLASVMILSVYIIFALELAGIFTGLVFVAGLVLLLFLRNKTYSSHSSGEEITLSTRDIYSSIIQHLEGMKTIKSFGMEEKNIKDFSQQTDHVVHSYMASVYSYADVRLLFDVGTVVLLAIVVLFLVEIIEIPVASLIVLIYLFVRMVPQFSTIQISYQYVLNMLPAYNNVIGLEQRCNENQELLEHDNEGQEFKKQISLEKVSFSYQDNHFALKNLNLSLDVGKTTAIAGPSGAGKSTIADLVMGFIEPSGGNVAVDGEPISHGSWRNQIGYVAQETFLFNETIRYNLQLARPGSSEEELKHVLKLAAAYEFVSKLPDGLDTLIGDRGVRLSGGERQRLALARALLRKPSLLILDESTSNLDSENEKRIMDAIDSLHGEITILVIAHRFSTIKNADYIYLIDDGEIIDSGTWDELLESKEGWFWDICEVQGLSNRTGP